MNTKFTALVLSLLAVGTAVAQTADVEIGHTSIIPCHLANISYRTGQRILWDAEREEIVGNPEAAKLLTKDYRAPWKLPLKMS